tara:strand:+ start:100 stop:414 length:315 start_codon:yes stop_codon:yes gene_type:complete
MSWQNTVKKVRELSPDGQDSPDRIRVFGNARPHYYLEGEYEADANKLYAEFEKAVNDIYVKYGFKTDSFSSNRFNQQTLKNGLEDIAEAILMGVKQEREKRRME